MLSWRRVFSTAGRQEGVSLEARWRWHFQPTTDRAHMWSRIHAHRGGLCQPKERLGAPPPLGPLSDPLRVLHTEALGGPPGHGLQLAFLAQGCAWHHPRTPGTACAAAAVGLGFLWR